MISRRQVLAVVVSYNGGSGIVRTLQALRAQIDHLLVVDNGSDQRSRGPLSEYAEAEGIEVVWLGTNRGIGAALNIGVGRARQAAIQWILTMDQDSVVDTGFLDECSAAHDRDTAVACLAAAVVPASAANAVVQHDRDVPYAITSGHLVRLSVYDAIGEYDEGLFIDCVDFDFCLRLRRAGYRIRRVARARLRHQLGDAVALPTWVGRIYARHSPSRRYYMYRNYLYLAERHMTRFPVFMLKLGALQLLQTFLIAAYDANPSASYRAVARGMRDYAARRLGPEMTGQS